MSFWKNRVDVSGSFDSDKVGKIRLDEVTAAVEAFLNVVSVTIGGFHFDSRKRLVAVRAVHNSILLYLDCHVTSFLAMTIGSGKLKICNLSFWVLRKQ